MIISSILGHIHSQVKRATVIRVMWEVIRHTDGELCKEIETQPGFKAEVWFAS